MTIRSISVLTIAVALVGLGDAEAQKSQARRSGGVTWHGDMDAVLKAAKKKPRKPILWVRALGDFEGDL